MRLLIRYWHLCSLDAPTIAAVWTYFIAHTVNVQTSFALLSAQFLAVWSIYAGDRLLDSFRHDRGSLEERHLFHARHSGRLSFLLIAATPIIWFLSTRIKPEIMHAYYGISAAVILYFTAVHLTKTTFQKEFFVGIIFALATFVPALTTRSDLFLELVPHVIQFAAIVWLNCLLIEYWENKSENKRFWIWVSVLVAIINFCLGHLFGNDLNLISQICIGSMLVLFGLHTYRRRFSAVQLRACADAALLTPIILILQPFSFKGF